MRDGIAQLWQAGSHLQRFLGTMVASERNQTRNMGHRVFAKGTCAFKVLQKMDLTKLFITQRQNSTGHISAGREVPLLQGPKGPKGVLEV